MRVAIHKGWGLARDRFQEQLKGIAGRSEFQNRANDSATTTIPSYSYEPTID